MITTYNFEFRPPQQRQIRKICFDRLTQRKYFNVDKYVKKPPEPQKNEKEQEAEEEEKRKKREKKFDEILYNTQWTPLCLFGRLVSPKLLPANMTPEEEELFMKLTLADDFNCMNIETNQLIKDDDDDEEQKEGDDEMEASASPKDTPTADDQKDSSYLEHERQIREEDERAIIHEVKNATFYKEFEENGCSWRCKYK